LIGAYVYDHSMDPARRISEGNKWHLTATKWSGTDLEKSMDNSDLVVTGHSTASCPKVGSDTRGLYVGGNGENPGRRITNRVGSNALWVGTNSDSSAQCYSGVASDNPVNASGGGVQLEKQVTTSNPVPDDVIAETVLGEY